MSWAAAHTDNAVMYIAGRLPSQIYQNSHLQQSCVMSPFDLLPVSLADPEMCACLAMIDPSLSDCGCVLSATMMLMACTQDTPHPHRRATLKFHMYSSRVSTKSKYVQSKDLDAEELLVCGEMEQIVQLCTVLQLACSDVPGSLNISREQPCSISAMNALPLSATCQSVAEQPGQQLQDAAPAAACQVYGVKHHDCAGPHDA